MVVGNAGNGFAEPLTETFDTASNQVCEISDFYTFTGAATGGVLAGARCDTVFGKGICCGGFVVDIDLLGPTDEVLLSDLCGFYDCFTHEWASIQDMLVKVYEMTPAIIRNERGRDIGWMWFGGSSEHGKQSHENYFL